MYKGLKGADSQGAGGLGGAAVKVQWVLGGRQAYQKQGFCDRSGGGHFHNFVLPYIYS